MLAENEIFLNTDAGVEIRHGGDPLLRHNRIHENLYGVFVHAGGQGTLDWLRFAGALVGRRLDSGG